MNFEILYEKYINGTATEEEKNYVESEIAKAKKLNEILESGGGFTPVISSADADTIKKAKRQYAKKSTLRTLIITVCVVVAVVIISILSVLGVAHANASKSLNISKSEAQSIALQFVKDNTTTGNIYVTDIDRHLSISEGIHKAYYYYEVEVQCGMKSYKLIVNGVNKIVKVEDID